MIEKELKLDLKNEENYLKILNFCGKPFEIKEQLNIFFDSNDFYLKKSKLSLRLRKENDFYLITVKGKNQSTGELSIRKEVETIISKDEFEWFVENNISLLSKDYPPFEYLREELGLEHSELIFSNILSFHNKRTVFIMANNQNKIKLEVDKTEFANKKLFFELEVEFDEIDSFRKNKEFIAGILKENDIIWKVSSKSKFKRALELL